MPPKTKKADKRHYSDEWFDAAGRESGESRPSKRDGDEECGLRPTTDEVNELTTSDQPPVTAKQRDFATNPVLVRQSGLFKAVGERQAENPVGGSGRPPHVSTYEGPDDVGDNESRNDENCSGRKRDKDDFI